eukprot:TRINITY_DN2219_c4_g1_i1.p1 TRINITY_DN2219_c4_g1~~TRINITY_DN2219_c4_g1_i1.p1  ORF type:complete len:276 (+),score=92.90 TRINITY_DN2219_c4_g1_i1:102-929(+)
MSSDSLENKDIVINDDVEKIEEKKESLEENNDEKSNEEENKSGKEDNDDTNDNNNEENNNNNKKKNKKKNNKKKKKNRNRNKSINKNDGTHRLNSKWTFWYSKQPKGQKKENIPYEDLLLKVGSFNTIENFWNYYTHLIKPSQLTKGSNIALFKNEKKPMWENFIHGGCWNIHFKKNSLNLDWNWEKLIFGIIGEVFKEPNIVGIVVSKRSGFDVLSIWNKTASNKNLCFDIGKKLENILQLSSTRLIEYKIHSHSVKDGSTYRNGKLYVVSSDS